MRGAILTTPAPAVPVALVPDGDGLAAEIGGAGRPVTALVAFYEPEHLTDVARGENGGRQLHEYRIVRAAAPLGAWDGAGRRLALPPVPPGLGVAVLVQGVRSARARRGQSAAAHELRRLRAPASGPPPQGPPPQGPPPQGHRTSGGRLIRIASTLPPVFRPNSVPRS